MAGQKKLCRVLGCRLPLVQAPMLGSNDERMALAVAKTGAVGSVPCSNMTPEAVGTLVSRHRREFPECCVNYNFFCNSLEVYDAALHARACEAFRGVYEAAGVACTPALWEGLRAACEKMSASPTFTEAHLDALVSGGARVVSFHFGLPAPALWAKVRASGLRTMACATTVAEARDLAAAGVDVVIAQGYEAGGHRGSFHEPAADAAAEQMGTFALVSSVRRVLGTEATVLAAGGIADAAGVHAATTLGADGVQVGTAFLLCDEATTSPAYRAALEAARVSMQPTRLMNTLTGRPARGLPNGATALCGALHYPTPAPPFPYRRAFWDPLRQLPTARAGEYDPRWCGQNPSGMRACPAAVKVHELLLHPDFESAPQS